MSNGIVVDHKESNVRYAISEHNFNEAVHTKVRDLEAGETVISFVPTPSGQSVEDDGSYHSFTVAQLQAEIDFRNESSEEDSQVVPDGHLKADLVAALEQDDELNQDD